MVANSDVVKPSRVRFLDYEIELGLVLRLAETARRDAEYGASPPDRREFPACSDRLTPPSSRRGAP